MFREDESSDSLLAVVEQMSSRKPEPEPEPEPPLAADVVELVNGVQVKTLRELLYENEPWVRATGGTSTSAIRRVVENRVNRTLATVADWMLSVVEERLSDEMTLVVLLELAERVREQIAWPERDSHASSQAQGPRQ